MYLIFDPFKLGVAPLSSRTIVFLALYLRIEFVVCHFVFMSAQPYASGLPFVNHLASQSSSLIVPLQCVLLRECDWVSSSQLSLVPSDLFTGIDRFIPYTADDPYLRLRLAHGKGDRRFPGPGPRCVSSLYLSVILLPTPLRRVTSNYYYQFSAS